MRRTIEKNTTIYAQMKEIYYDRKTNLIDWMGNLITEDNHRTYHHITKAEEQRDNGESDVPTLENGAFLGKRSHEQLHRIEHIDHDLYIAWNLLFREINDTRDVITEELWDRIFELHEITEKVDKSNKKVLKL